MLICQRHSRKNINCSGTQTAHHQSAAPQLRAAVRQAGISGDSRDVRDGCTRPRQLMPALFPYPATRHTQRALYMPDQLFTVCATGGVAPLKTLASDRGWQPLPTTLPSSPSQAF